ncbi:MAG: glycosyl hydrolase [Pseudomonadales bacterium]
MRKHVSNQLSDMTGALGNTLQHRLVAISIGMMLLVGCSNASTDEAKQNAPADNQATEALVRDFITPPDTAKLGTYWYWMNDNISLETTQKDLKFMKDMGIGRAFIGNIGNYVEPGDVKIFSDEWWNITVKAIETASEYGIDIGLFNSPGWSMSGGPWIDNDESMRYLASVKMTVQGPVKLRTPLDAGPDFGDVAMMAFPTPKGINISDLKPKVSASIPLDDIENLVDGDIGTTVGNLTNPLKSAVPVTIDFTLNQPLKAQSLQIFPAGSGLVAHVTVQAFVDGAFKTIKEFQYNRRRKATDSLTGFMPFGPEAVSFSPTTSTKFRLIFDQLPNKYSEIAEIQLSSSAVVENFVEKQLGVMKDDPSPMWTEYKWKPQGETAPEYNLDPASVIDISEKLDGDGTLNWDVPAGDWTIVRYGMRTTGRLNAPASPEGTGFELDKMGTDVVAKHFNSYMKKFQDRVPGEKGKSLKWVVADSYEAGSQNWTDDFADAFHVKYNYDPKPWLPVFNGIVVGSAAQSNRFMWDVRRLIADLISYRYVGGMNKVSKENGMRLWLENYGHWGFPGEFLQYGGQTDGIAGEFWSDEKGDSSVALGSIEVKAAASAAHIYGKTKVSIESFTSDGYVYGRYPDFLKQRGDFAFANGGNDILLHLYITDPEEDRVPGMNAWFGTEFNRKNTWFPHADGFTDYLRRTMHMLQQGLPVNDVAYFIGESTPAMTGPERPALPKGYSYDFINAEVLLNRVSVDDGDLVLPEGVRYKLLVLPPLDTMRPEVLARISSLVEQGATIFGPAPTSSPSLEGYPQSDQKVQTLAAALWGDVNGKDITAHQFGKGAVYNGDTLNQVLANLQLLPDVHFKTGLPVLFNHRKTAEKDIYFVANQSDKPLTFTPTFRIVGKQPEHWNPVTTQIRDLPEYQQTNGGITVPLTLAPKESAFIVFSRPLTQFKEQALSKQKNFPTPMVSPLAVTNWQVQFDTARGGPKVPVIFDELSDWSTHSDPAIKSYSGTAVYKTSFTVDSLNAAQQYKLDLGKVKVIAKVKVNGVDVGSAWTSPWAVDVSDALKQGENTLEIMVVNTWVNKLVTDLELPEDQRSTWVSYDEGLKGRALDPSGLMGPVTLQAVPR